MAALRCFSNYGKSLAGQSKASHFGETYRDMRHIIIKKVPHRVKQFTTRKTSYESSADVQRWLREQGYEDEEQQSSQSSQNGQNAPAFNPTLLASRRDAPWILSSLSPFYDQHLIMDVLHEAHSGKEATVFCCEAHPSTGMEYLAAKIYRPRMFRSLRNDAVYRYSRVQRDEQGQAEHGNSRRGSAATRKTERGRAAQVASGMKGEIQIDMTRLAC